MIKSPLRYPGGKSKAIPQILPYLPPDFQEYREPFVGGGSLFIDLKQRHPQLKVWINDLNPELFWFWKSAQTDLDTLVAAIRQVKATATEGKLLFQELVAVDPTQMSGLDRAVRFFVLNRITFSGTIEAGGFSEQSFQQRFTHSCIDRLASLHPVLDTVHITNLDYGDLLNHPGSGVFLFLDPPYLSATKSKLYGKKGTLHTVFDHQRFAQALQACPHQWLITYDDSPEIRDLFSFANLYSWEMQYGMNNYKQGFAAKGKELFITNYPVVRA